MLNRLFRVEALLARDVDRDLSDLHRRDRAIAVALPGLTQAPAAAQVLGWAEAVENRSDIAASSSGTGTEGGIDDGPRQDSSVSQASSAGADQAWQAARLALSSSGWILGIGVASGLLFFDGAGRVNVITGLGVLVVLQAVTVAATIVLMLPSAIRQRVPGVAAAQTALGLLSPARVLPSLLRRLPAGTRGGLHDLSGRVSSNRRVFGPLSRWLALVAAQQFGVAFNIGVLLAFLTGVLFTDLAFGWSTTLDVEPSTLHQLTTTLSLPWAGWLPQAVPSMELIDASRYFRVESTPPADPAVLGGWWPFVGMCLLLYAAMPRIILLVIARVRLGRVWNWTLTHLPGAPELLHRMNTEVVETRAMEPEIPPAFAVERPAEGEPLRADDAAEASAPESPATGVHGPCSVIVWGDFDPEPETAKLILSRTAGFAMAQVMRAGAGTLQDDKAAIEAAVSHAQPIAMLVKSWEPPLGDLVDFLADLRGAVGEVQPIAVVLVSAEPLEAPSPTDLETWRSRLARVGDPRLRVYALRSRS